MCQYATVFIMSNNNNQQIKKNVIIESVKTKLEKNKTRNRKALDTYWSVMSPFLYIFINYDGVGNSLITFSKLAKFYCFCYFSG